MASIPKHGERVHTGVKRVLTVVQISTQSCALGGRELPHEEPRARTCRDGPSARP
jgi:hypothetical protein